MRALAAVLLLAACATSRPVPGEKAGAPTWLVGGWVGDHSIEAWHPAGKALLGFGAEVQDGRTRFFEVMTITGAGDELVLTPRPNGGAAVPFKLAHLDVAEVVFANPAHDFPKEIGYARHGDRLDAHVSAPSGPREEEAFTAGALPPAPALEAADKATRRRDGWATWSPTASGLSPAGDLGYTTGRWEGKNGRGTYMTVWKKQADGGWQIAFDTGLPD